MPIYTDDPGLGINQPIGNAPSGLGESLLSSLQQGFEEGPVMSGYRFAQADVLANDPNSAVVSKADADERLKQYGVKSINVPDTGVTQAFLDHVVAERKDSLARQQIAASAPSGWVVTPLNFTASLAGSMADPGNVALAFVPFAGEARVASMLGRFGERFVAGSRLGAAQAVATVPFTAMAAAADGDDFTYGNALESTFFNTLAGGLMHAGGGVISDLVRPKLPQIGGVDSSSTPDPAPLREAENINGIPENQPDPFRDIPAYVRRGDDPFATSQPVPVETPDNIPAGVNIPERGTNSDLSAAISSDAENYAYSRAYDDVVPEYMAQQRELQTGQIDNVADLRAELTANQRQADALDATVQQRTTDYQSQRMKFKDARARAMKDIQAEKDAFTSRNAEINNTLEQNAAAEQARGRQSQVNKGEIPDDLKVRIAERAQQIRDGMQMSPVAGAVRTAAGAIREADWAVNQQAYRAALAHMMEGRSPDVEPFYELHTPALRERAIQRIQNPVRQMDETARPVSETADRVYRETQQADHEVTAAAADLENEFNLSNALLDDIAVDNPELAATMRENLNAIRAEASDNSMSNAFRAFAACMINRGI